MSKKLQKGLQFYITSEVVNMSDKEIISSIIESVSSNDKRFGTTLKQSLNSYSSYVNWLNYTTSQEVGRVMALVNDAMTNQGLWKGSGGIVRSKIKELKRNKSFMSREGINPILVKRKLGILKSFTYKFLGGINELSEDQNSGALVGGVTAYRTAGRDLVKNDKLQNRLNTIKGVYVHKVFDDTGKVINKQKKGRDINAVVTLIEKHTGINILSDDQFSKYSVGKKITALNQALHNSERSKKFSLENDKVGDTLLNRFRSEVERMSKVIDI
jgi:predicted RNA-binding protein YlqC (UPF0109 family)